MHLTNLTHLSIHLPIEGSGDLTALSKLTHVTLQIEKITDLLKFSPSIRSISINSSVKDINSFKIGGESLQSVSMRGDFRCVYFFSNKPFANLYKQQLHFWVPNYCSVGVSCVVRTSFQKAQ